VDQNLEYLLSFLSEEFSGYPGVRVRATPRSGIKRSIDLVQDYEPESSDLHLRSGVMVTAKGREYYFPVEWVVDKKFGEIQKNASLIREWIES
jgi:hypothetical protein